MHVAAAAAATAVAAAFISELSQRIWLQAAAAAFMTSTASAVTRFRGFRHRRIRRLAIAVDRSFVSVRSIAL